MKTREGFALIFALVIAMIILAIIIGLAAIASGDLSLAARATDGIRAYYLAEAGLAKKFVELRSGSTMGTGGTITLSSGNTGTFNVIVSQTGGGVFPTYVLTSTGTYKNSTKTLSLTVRAMSYSRYIYLTDTEIRSGSRIWFIGGDAIRGPMHTNGQLNIIDDPTFEGPVSSVSTSIHYYHGPPPLDNPDFRESLTLGAPNIRLPTSADILSSLSASAQQSNGLYLIGDSTVTLLSNGTMNVTNADKDWDNYNVPVPPSGALFVNNGDLNISGILSGQLTVGNQGTGKNIYITGNILYANDPRTNPSSTDIFGIVSGNNVVIDSAAPYNLEIDGYILALNKSFYLENYTSVVKGTLTLFGGITQDERGAVGTFNASTGQKVSGYTKDYNYDQRFEDSAPAFFPPARDSNNRIVYLKILWAET
ncbi:MAG: DUF4900 domain-containing protein [Candidatus Omnitrophota bacterium]|nr:DUF4900 domain-containing protein [Candidatus Omnitrophota bacterium]